jgi:hypothetical protein
VAYLRGAQKGITFTVDTRLCVTTPTIFFFSTHSFYSFTNTTNNTNNNTMNTNLPWNLQHLFPNGLNNAEPIQTKRIDPIPIKPAITKKKRIDHRPVPLEPEPKPTKKNLITKSPRLEEPELPEVEVIGNQLFVDGVPMPPMRRQYVPNYHIEIDF